MFVFIPSEENGEIEKPRILKFTNLITNLYMFFCRCVTGVFFFSLFNGISTFVGYSMSKSSL